MIYIETKRLLLRDWKTSDLLPFSKMNSDKAVMHYFPDTLSYPETTAFYESIVTEFQKEHYGLYALECKETNEFIGFTGFHQATFQANFTPCVEIGWRLKKTAQGKGYATEAAKACLKYGTTELGLKQIYSFTAKENRPSIRVMQKIGMEFAGEFNHPRLSDGHWLRRHVLYQYHV